MPSSSDDPGGPAVFSRSGPGCCPRSLCAAAALSDRLTLLSRLNDGAGDVLRRALAPSPPGPRVIVVDIDEASLAAEGQWPWRRDRLAALVERLREDGARVIALDRRVQRTRSVGEPETAADAAFAETLRRGGVIVGYALTFGRAAAHRHPRLRVCTRCRSPSSQPPGTQATGPCSKPTGRCAACPRSTSAAGRSGFLNATPDGDGTLRRVPLRDRG